MGRCFFATLLLCLFLSPPAAIATPNPHDLVTSEDCLNCHNAGIADKVCDAADNFCLLAETVDAVCLKCHVKENCCPVGMEHQAKLFLGRYSHPSNLRISDIQPAHLPRTLPIHQWRITCRTCHLHTRAKPKDYAMLRLVAFTQEGVDWAPLCGDCHEEYR